MEWKDNGLPLCAGDDGAMGLKAKDASELHLHLSSNCKHTAFKNYHGGMDGWLDA